MKRTIIISLLIIITFIIVHSIRKRKNDSLGRVNLKRPPKVRIVYSKKVKPNERPKVTKSEDAVEILRGIWSKQIEAREEVFALLMDKNNRVLGYQLVGKGGVSGVVMDSRLILSVAIQTLSSGVILAHNHPSGNINPSSIDLKITQRIKKALKLMGINLLDHIILTKHDFYSFADYGGLEDENGI